MQNLIQQPISGQLRSSRISELHNKLQQITPGLVKPAPGCARGCACKAARTFPINISADDVVIDQRMQRGMKPPRLAREFRNGLNDDPEPRQAAHGRAQRGRIHALAAGVHCKGTHKAVRHAPEQNLIKLFSNEKTAIIRQSLLAETTIRLGAHIESMMPGHVESQSFDCGRVAQVVQLLQEQNADDDVQILRRTTQPIIEMRQQFIDRKIIKKVVSEHPAQERSSSRRRFSPISDQRSNKSPVLLSHKVNMSRYSQSGAGNESTFYRPVNFQLYLLKMLTLALFA
ncbi:MAG: hypothetical protein PF480_11245 [Roseovarius sp.]|nr:hypothetical protein [Roseovarius sp.]